jgi:hypothetical protein
MVSLYKVFLLDIKILREVALPKISGVLIV